MSQKPHIMIVEARFYEDIADFLVSGTLKVLEDVGASFERFAVPGALEIPGAIKRGSSKKGGQAFDAYVALGCVIRGETSHYDIVAGESARGIMDLTIHDSLAIGNGILTCDNREQALVRADPAQKNKGGDAALAALAFLEIDKELNR